MTDFHALGLSQPLMHALKQLKFTTPTPIQQEAIPVALTGKDVLGSAQTGTGKTVAFGIPLVEHLLANPTARALVITPTRELAAQVMKSLRTLLHAELRKQTVLLIGGESITRQLATLRYKPRLVVGTPGRINDHLARGSVSFKATTFLVLDETDRMLDMGFSSQIEEIVAQLPRERQTLLFSATMPPAIVRASQNYLDNPKRIAIDAHITAAPKITQEVVHVSEKEKLEQLLEQLTQREGSVIVFVKTKIKADKVAFTLRKYGHQAHAIHSDLRHSKRERVLRGFTKQHYRIMVATDIAARGLDVPHIEHVINYDLPQCPEDYIHRIGRTARAGASGAACCFISPAEKGIWQDITALLNPDEAEKNRSRQRPSGRRRTQMRRRGASASRSARHTNRSNHRSKTGQQTTKQRSGGRRRAKKSNATGKKRW